MLMPALDARAVAAKLADPLLPRLVLEDNDRVAKAKRDVDLL
jgi:hypothetical protein